MSPNNRFPLKAGRAIAAAGMLAALAAMPASAAAAPYKGTVIAKDAARQTVVTTDRRGAVRTIRVERRARRVHTGQRLIARGSSRRADGTYAAKRVRVAGHARKARVRAAVVQKRRGRYLVSAGSTTFSIRSGIRASAASARIEPGDIVVVDVSLDSGVLSSEHIKRVGETSVLELEGIFLSLADATLEIAVEKRGLVKVNVPDALDVSAAAGDELELLVSIGQDGTFTLVALDGDDQDEAGIDFDAEDGEVEIEGSIGALSDDSITVEAGGPSASATCAVPTGVSLTGFAVNDAVEMECELVDGAFELRELESDVKDLEVEFDPEEDDDDQGEDEDDHEDDDEQDDEQDDDEQDDDEE